MVLISVLGILVGGAASLIPSPIIAAPMQAAPVVRWEYACVWVNSSGGLGICVPGKNCYGRTWSTVIAEYNRKAVLIDAYPQDAINAVGSDGWELTAVEGDVKWWFKRAAK